MSGATDYVDGQVGKALDFDGVDDYVNVADSGSLDIVDELTISTWIYGESYSPNTLILHKEPAYGLWYDWSGSAEDNGELQFMVRSNGAWNVCDSDFNPVSNQWYHLLGSYNSTTSTCKIYIDGKLKKSKTVS